MLGFPARETVYVSVVETVKGGKILKLKDSINKTTPEHSPAF